MESPTDSGPSESVPSNASWWPSSFEDKLHSVSISSHDDNLFLKEAAADPEHGGSSPNSASQILWASGSLSGPIPNGFFSVVPDKRLTEIFDKIPSPDDIRTLGIEGVRADIILVDSEKDKKLSMLKQLVVALVKGPNLSLASVIKKIAGLVSDVYRRPNSDLSPAKSVVEEMGNIVENRFQLLGQIKHGSCRPRAILFKVLADTVGLECKLMVGIPGDGPTECVDSHRHMSVVVLFNSVEMLVDLMRFPGQLMPFSTKAVFTSHISAAGESDSAENDSCDSPLEPNSPLYGLSDKLDTDSLSHSEPNTANTLWRRSRQKAVAEQRTASSSPEHPLFRARGRSILSGGRHSFREYGDRVIGSRSDGASSPDSRRIRRRSISITPEISDDIVSAVRAINETLKQNRPLKDQCDETSYSYNAGGKNDESGFHTDEAAARRSAFDFSRKQIISSQKAMSLPSSPHEVRDQISDRGEISSSSQHGDLLATWNKVLQSSSVLTKPLLPFEEWNIDFSELTVGTRVGIGFFGEVFRGMWNGTDVAIKVFLEQDLTTENMEDFCNEIMIMSRLRHPNVILFLGACTEPPRLSMVTEYMEMGSLYYLIHSNDNKKRLTWRRRLKMLQDICRGLMCMHGKRIVHRDLKSANCLVNKHWTVKICDFGLSRVMTENPMRDSSSAGTPEWMAPELIRNEPFTEKCDIFGLGVIMWEFCTLSRPWEGVPPVQVVYAVANEGSRLDIPEGPLGKLISDCWAEPDERPSCKEILTRLLDCEYTLC